MCSSLSRDRETLSLTPGMSMLFKPSYSEHLILLGQSDYFKNGMWPNQSRMALSGTQLEQPQFCWDFRGIKLLFPTGLAEYRS